MTIVVISERMLVEIMVMQKRILLVSLTPFYGGGEVYLENLAVLLEKHNFCPIVYCRSTKLYNNLTGMNIKAVMAQDHRYTAYWKNLKTITDLAIKYETNHIHLNGNRELFFAFYFRKEGYTVTATKHTFPHPVKMWGAKLRNWLIYKCINQTHATICVSKSLYNVLQEQGVSTKQLVPIRNAPHPRYTEDEYQQNTQRETITILMLSRLELLKGYQDLCMAAKGLSNIKLVFAGDGHIEDLRKYGQDDQIRFLGHVNDTKALIHDADIVALPSYYEGGCPLALLEAMAMSKPVIATKIPTIIELIDNKIDGYLINCGDVAALRQIIIYLSGEPGVRHDVGHKAHEKISKKFSPVLWETQTLNFFKSNFDTVSVQ